MPAILCWLTDVFSLHSPQLPLLPYSPPSCPMSGVSNVLADSYWISISESHCLNTNCPLRPPVLYIFVSLDKGEHLTLLLCLSGMLPRFMEKFKHFFIHVIDLGSCPENKIQNHMIVLIIWPRLSVGHLSLNCGAFWSHGASVIKLNTAVLASLTCLL